MLLTGRFHLTKLFYGAFFRQLCTWALPLNGSDSVESQDDGSDQKTGSCIKNHHFATLHVGHPAHVQLSEVSWNFGGSWPPNFDVSMSFSISLASGLGSQLDPVLQGFCVLLPAFTADDVVVKSF